MKRPLDAAMAALREAGKELTALRAENERLRDIIAARRVYELA